MYQLKKSRKQYYRATPGSSGALSPLWLLAIVLTAAIVLGLIVGGILAGKAAGSASDGKTHRNLVKFGGVEDPAQKYSALVEVKGISIPPDSLAKTSFSNLVAAGEGNSVEICLYDGETVWYNSAVASSLGMAHSNDISLTAIKNILQKQSKYSVVRFVTSAFSAADAAARAMQRAKEMAILAEIAQAGFSEIDIFGLPVDFSLGNEVNIYMAEASGMVGEVSLFASVAAAADVGEAATLISAAEEYADGFVLDCRGISGQALNQVIESRAYYISVYAMRPRISAETDVAVLGAYGIDHYIR